MTPRPLVSEIQSAVCEYFGCSMAELLSPNRHRIIARPRQIGMYLSREMTAQPCTEIGRRFGGRDHTTIIHGIRQIEDLRALIPEIEQDLHHIRIIVTRSAHHRAKLSTVRESINQSQVEA